MRSVLKVLLPAFALLFGGLVHAQYPTRPVKIVVPSTAGDGSDVLARTLAKAMGESMGQPFVIENRPGAGGSIGAAVVAKSASDGYTLFLGNGSSHGVTPSLYPRLPYDSISDFAPIALSHEPALGNRALCQRRAGSIRRQQLGESRVERAESRQ